MTSKTKHLKHILEGAVVSAVALYAVGYFDNHVQLSRVGKDCLSSGANQAFCGCIQSEVAAHLPQSRFEYAARKLTSGFYEEQDGIKVAAYQACSGGTSGGVHHSF